MFILLLIKFGLTVSAYTVSSMPGISTNRIDQQISLVVGFIRGKKLIHY